MDLSILDAKSAELASVDALDDLKVILARAQDSSATAGTQYTTQEHIDVLTEWHFQADLHVSLDDLDDLNL